ncbi:MAG: Holliday junction resolvase RuvX [Dehalococcoidia bacterium]|nr:Holliday junction resolvase RuvX [Dehalococcoidia bacterium]
MRILGLDIGDRRIGAALSDPTGILASPHSIIERTADEKAIEGILKIIAEKEVGRIVAGLPCSMDGSIGHQAEKVKAFTEQLRQRTSVPIEYRDERLTTVTAMRLKQEASTRRLDRKTRYDAMAAAIILQEYLDEKPAKEYQI